MIVSSVPYDKTYHAKYKLRRYHARRAEIIEQLGGQCQRCGGTENLELDHIDPLTKKHDIAKILASCSKAAYLAEVALCQLLCSSCHTEKSSAESSVPHGGGVSGKRNCKCEACRVRKNQYMRDYKKARRKKLAPFA